MFIISARCDQSINNQHVVKAVLNGSDKYNEVLCVVVVVVVLSSRYAEVVYILDYNNHSLIIVQIPNKALYPTLDVL